MDNLIKELKGKSVHIVFDSAAYTHGGVAAANYKILGYADGFLKLSDWRNEITYCKMSLINRITLLKTEKEKSCQLEVAV